MALCKRNISYVLYVLAILLLAGEGIETIWFFKEFIFSGKGIGVYGVLIYYAAAFFSVVFWSVSYWLSHNKKLAIIYWIIFLIFTIFITFQPTWWAAPSISS